VKGKNRSTSSSATVFIQIRHGLAWNQTCYSFVKGWRLTTWSSRSPRKGQDEGIHVEERGFFWREAEYKVVNHKRDDDTKRITKNNRQQRRKWMWVKLFQNNACPKTDSRNRSISNASEKV